MNLICHILKKDVRRFRWELLIWASAFVYSLYLRGDYQSGDWQAYCQVLANITWAVLSLAMIVGVVQEDNLMETKVHWKTRAIPPEKLLMAKLVFIVPLFVVLPLVTAWQILSVPGAKPLPLSVGLYLGFGVLAVPLLFAALAACTKSLGHAMLLFLGVVAASAALAYLLGQVTPGLDRRTLSSLFMAKAVLILGSMAVLSVGVLISQYLIRQFWVSVSLLTGGVVVVAVIGASWTWNFFR
jgi:hypothetical protein